MKHRPKRRLDQVRDAIRLKHYMIRTEESCVTWIKRYILFYNKRPSLEMASAEIEPFPTHLAVDKYPRAGRLWIWQSEGFTRKEAEHGFDTHTALGAMTGTRYCERLKNDHMKT